MGRIGSADRINEDQEETDMISSALVLLLLLFVGAILGLYVVRCLHRIRLDISRIRELMERDSGRGGGVTPPVLDPTPPGRDVPSA